MQGQNQVVLAVKGIEGMMNDPSQLHCTSVALALLGTQIGSGRWIRTVRNRILSKGRSRSAHGRSAAQSLRPCGAAIGIGLGTDGGDRFGERQPVAGDEPLEAHGERAIAIGGSRWPPASPFTIALVEEHTMQDDREIRAQAAGPFKPSNYGVVVLDELEECEGSEFVELIAADTLPPSHLSHNGFDERQI
jgi:hypothetical protein